MVSRQQRGGRHGLFVPSLLFFMALGFYLITLAPTVLWGDDAMFQRWAAQNVLARDGSGHWLWMQIARASLLLPVGDIAYRVNLVSAVAGALAVGLLYAVGRALGLAAVGAAAAAVSLAVSHTFWTHAVRAEVYTVYLVLMALQLYFWFQWRPGRPLPLLAAGLLFGTTLLGHQMGLLLVPGLAYLCWRQRRWLSLREWLLVAIGTLIGMVPFVVFVQAQVGGTDLPTALRVYFTRAGQDFGLQMFDFGLSMLGRDGVLWLGFLGLQFAGPAFLLGLYSLVRGRDWLGEVRWQTVLIVYATSVAFAFSYRVNDQYVFYLPSYLAAALFVGLGLELAVARWRELGRGLIQWAVIGALALAPIGTYFLLATALSEAGMNPLGVRALPGREPNWFFLWPAKHGYTGAKEFANAVLAVLPSGSLLIADHTPFEPLAYVQEVEGIRSDVTLVKVAAAQELSSILATADPDQPVFLADDDPRYMNLTRVPTATLEPFGLVYRVLDDRALTTP